MAPDRPRDRRLMADIAAERPAPLSPQSWCSSAVDCMGMGRVLQAGATDRPGTRMTGIHPTHAGVADGAGGIVEGLMKKVVLASVIGALGAPAFQLDCSQPKHTFAGDHAQRRLALRKGHDVAGINPLVSQFR